MTNQQYICWPLLMSALASDLLRRFPPSPMNERQIVLGDPNRISKDNCVAYSNRGGNVSWLIHKVNLCVCVAYLYAMSSFRLLSSSMSNAELVLLRVTDKLCVSYYHHNVDRIKIKHNGNISVHSQSCARSRISVPVICCWGCVLHRLYRPLIRTTASVDLCCSLSMMRWMLFWLRPLCFAPKMAMLD